MKDSLPYSQALRIKRICPKDIEFDKNCTELKTSFSKRGYKNHVIEKQIEKAKAVPRPKALQYKTKQSNDRIPLVTTFHTNLPQLGTILNKHWPLLHIKPNVKSNFIDTPIVAYKRSNNLRDILGGNKIENGKKVSKSKKHIVKYCRPCNVKGSQCCQQVNFTNTFICNVTNREYKIFHETTCKSKYVVYLLECMVCNLQYVGKSETQFNIRLNNYRSAIKKLPF